MFARKKPQDFQSSLQRFTDMCRDPMSRAKHLKIILDNLNPQEKRQVIEGFSFEIYHLLNGLIFSHYDLPADPQTPVDLESALAILEQILLFAPEFIGKGWQRNGMEFIFKMILHPKNAIAVRKLAIRLFIIWYQILSISGHSSRQLDMVFQCCLPDFPLRNGQSAEQIMTIYCEGSEPNTSATNNNFGFEPCAAKCILPEQPTSPQGGQPGKLSVRERADNLQKYIDKFLEYNIRETVKINWLDPNQKLDCAKFLIDRIIVLYIYEQFPEAELNGIDVYDGWEGTFEDDENARLQDTADPIIIAKYWLIRWMINIAFGPQLLNNGHQEMMKTGGNTSISGIQLFKQALFSSRRATNILLTLIREAFRLPLACINVIQKAIELLRYWLFQEEFPNFIDTQLVSVEDWSLLLIRMLFSFFRSPYLNSVSEKLPSAVSITHSILQIVRDLANPSAVLPCPLTKKVWQELLNELIYALEFAAAKPDSFGKATAGGIARNFVSILIFICTIRDVDIADTAMWDDLIIVLQNCVWPAQVMEQWSRIVPNLTRAMILNIFKMEINTQKGSDVVDELTSQQQQFTENASSDGSRNYPLSQSRADRISNSSASTGSSSAFNAAIASLCDGMDEEERQLGIGSINITAGGNDQTSTAIVDEKWLRAWMRMVCLANFIGADQPSNSPYQQLAIMQTLGRAIQMLASTGCSNSLIHWLAAHLLQLENVAAEPHAIPIIFGVLISSAPPPLERAYILRFLLHALRTGNNNSVPILLDHIPLISELEDMAVISTETIATLQKLVKNQEFSSRAIRVAALLSLNHTEAEKILISLLEQRQIQIDQTSFTLCVNALSLLILERADATLFDHLLNLLFNHQYASRILPIFCANIGLVVRLGFHSQLMDSLMLAQSKVKNANALNDLKWQICAINSKESITHHWNALVEKFAASSDSFFEDFMIRLSAQFPLPGFNITQWNSLPFRPQQSTQQTMTAEEAYNDIYMDTGGAIINLEKENPQTLWSRTCLGRHAYQIEEIQIEEEQCSLVDDWLQTLSEEQYFTSQFTASARKKSIEEIFDPFKEFPTPSFRSFTSTAMAQNSSDLIPLDISVPEMLQFIQASSRGLEELNLGIEEEMRNEKEDTNQNVEQCGWRQFLTSFGLLDLAKNPPTNFQREIRHLDNTICREVHKVAIIYVGRDQQDKQTILSNTLGSDNFNKFVDALGWPVQIGSPEFFGYTGGLPIGQLAPYYATANTELIFHVSTLLAGDTTQRLKHIGNDEVHVVWSENPSKPYRRDLIATRFCDVLIVLYVVSQVLLRVHIEVQDQRIQFGPLFDGACIHTHQAASLVRETVLNASRAYRNLKVECDRPNKHREKVFGETRQRMGHLSLSASITRLFAPNTTE